MNIPHIITVSGPSLSGKTELSKILQNQYSFNSVISVTTRPQRGQEIEGKDYYFITKENYDKLNLIQKTNFNNAYYGVEENEVLSKREKPILWVVAPESVNQIEAYCANNNFNITKIFVTNPEEILYERLLKRFKEDEKASIETYAKRLVSMINIEKEWTKEAQTNPSKYDIVINEFNENNTKEVIKKVLVEIQNKESLNNLNQVEEVLNITKKNRI